MTLDVLLTTNNLCQIFQVNRSTIHRWVGDGRLPKAVLLGPRSPRWTQAQIDNFMERNGAKEAL
ncbi:helix-turn-helix domain-containing protein [Alteromonas sp. AO-Serp]|uniref:helix-turn-helix transcriptional regulator n=1 Tax=Alteromonas sp. AO-Serp TaxID=2804349 RepID=UPI002580A969|nr:helix-turn-helix domain-containing protein [Alteromonas sp. AO-Serp]